MDVDSINTLEKLHAKSRESDQLNGLSNGYPEKHKSHKSEHKDKSRDKDRDKDKHRSKDHKSSSKDKDRDKDRHSSTKDKERHSSSKSSKDKDRDRDRDRDRNRHHDHDKQKHRDRNDKKDSSSSSKDKEHKSSREKDYKSSSSHDKTRDRERDEKYKDKHRERHSSNKDRDRDRHSSTKDKREKDKHHSSSKEKEKEKKEKEIVEIYKPVIEDNIDSAKEDSVDEDEPKLVIKEEPFTQNDSDVNASTASSCDYNLSQFKDEPNTKEEYDQDIKVKDEYKIKVEESQSSDEDIPLATRKGKSNKRQIKIEDDDEEDDEPLLKRKKIKKEKKQEKKRKKLSDDDDDDYYDQHAPIKKGKVSKKKIKTEPEESYSSPDMKKGRKKKEEEQEVWKWWEEEKRDDGVKWTFLEHKGPVFAPPYEKLPADVKFYYNGKEMQLSEAAEEVAGFYAKMLEHDYTTKAAFNNNFFKDWREVMTEKERSKITDLGKCDFRKMHAYFMDVAEKNRNRTKEEKKSLKEKNEELVKEYGFCKIDGHTERIGNFKIEPPGLFRGRGEHPRMGMLKKRILAREITINCSKDSKIPVPPEGQKWKEVRHDSAVTWLAAWNENVQNQVKYIMLNSSSKLKGEKDWQKYEIARRLDKSIEKIRHDYRQDWKSKEMRVRQRAVAMYFIDKLALRAGNEKDEDQADTVGCCSLRVEHIELHEKKDDLEYVVVFDFLGKDSIRYYNEVSVEKRVFKNLQLFMENKKEGDDLFDRLNTSILNKHLTELMEGLTAKVFRTYNASFTLQQQLDELTNEDDTVSEKILSYNRANRAVAILCNHQRSVPKGHEKSMGKLKEKIDAKKESIRDAELQVKDAQREAKHGSVKEKVVYEKKKKILQRMKDQLSKLEIQETDRDENKTIALGTSKLNYLDPRISVAWCKKNDVPIEKIYNKTQRDKFRWAIDMAGPDYRF